MTSPAYRLIHRPPDSSYVFKWEPFDLGTRWHYHPELELAVFLEGKTSGIIGQEFHEFDTGDIILLGSNLPHVLRPNELFSTRFPDILPFGLILQFREDFLGEDFFRLQEWKSVQALMQRAKRGLRFSPEAIHRVMPHILSMPDMKDTKRLLTLLDVLHTLSDDQRAEYLTAQGYMSSRLVPDEDRMLRVNEYLYRNFRETIRIEDVSALVNMTPTSFCRYFKSRTLKTFTRYLNEIRISCACQLLRLPGYTVSDACFESGFNSLSYFNRQFRGLIRVSPRQYQGRYRIR